jgi:peptide-methionine (R)-S-oxide reductase
MITATERNAMKLLPEEKDGLPRAIGRRTFIIGVGTAAIAATWIYMHKDPPVHAAAEIPLLPKTVKIVNFTDAGQRKDTVTVSTIVKTEDEWRKQLSRDSFEVTRHAETERPYTDEDPNHGAKGVFRCICCDTALFNANTKFESGTGWPSFWQPIAAENVLETNDFSYGMTRTAVACRLCDAHLGHVFDDGPQPTGLRYCMNSVSLRFAKAT